MGDKPATIVTSDFTNNEHANTFFQATSASQNILLACAGGGFDIISGLPLYFFFRNLGKNVVLANLSFSALNFSNSKKVCSGTYRVDNNSQELPYFPEKFVLDWLRAERGEQASMYAFPDQIGVRPLAAAYAKIIKTHQIDTVILVDGGTDSLMFGDETRVGTIIEDACSIAAVSQQPHIKSYLAAIGFGVEHDFNHHACLENIATLTKHDQFLGNVAITKSMPEGEAFLQLVEYLNQHMPLHRSIVMNSIASAVKGEFGDLHFTQRTKDTAQFISPLMNMYWFFELQGIYARIGFAKNIINTETKADIVNVYQDYRQNTAKRPEQSIPIK